MKRILSLALTVLMVLSLVACSSGSQPSGESEPAQDFERTEPLVLRWGATGSGSSDDGQWVFAEPVIAEIEEKTNGMIQFEYYPSSQLGAETSMLDQVTMGTLDMCTVSPNTLATIWPDTVLMNYPFAYPDLDVYWDTWSDPDLVAAVNADILGGGVVRLGDSSVTYRGCQNATRAIHNVSDMKGLTFRTMAGQIYVDIFGAMGAATASVAASEVFTAIQQGLVDGEETGVNFCYDNGYWEVEKYATELNAVLSASQVLMSADTWNKLSASEQEIFRTACTEGVRERMTEFTNGNTDYYYEQLAEKGLEVVRWADMSEEDQQSFVQAVMPLWDKYKDTIDPEVFDLWITACSAAWEKNGYTWTYEPA